MDFFSYTGKRLLKEALNEILGTMWRFSKDLVKFILLPLRLFSEIGSSSGEESGTP